MPFDFKRLLSNEQMRKFLMLFLAVALCIFTAFWLAARNSSTVDAEFKQCHEACTRVSGLRRHQGSKPAEVADWLEGCKVQCNVTSTAKHSHAHGSGNGTPVGGAEMDAQGPWTWLVIGAVAVVVAVWDLA